MPRYFVIHNLAENEAEIIRFAALLRGTESAWQAVSYGLESVRVFAEVGGVYLQFGLGSLSILPAWHIVKHFRIASDQLGDSEGLGVESVSIDEANSDDGREQVKNA